MIHCHIDIETFSELPLPKVGAYRYAEHPSTETMCVCWAFGEGDVSTWATAPDLPAELITRMEEYHDLYGGEFYFGLDCPDELLEHAESGGVFRAHNAEFERTLLNGHVGERIGFPETDISQWVCTAAKAAAHSLPRALGRVAETVNSPCQKNQTGKNDMMALCKPRKKAGVPRWTPENSPDRFYGLYTYCVDDVEAERAIDHIIPDISPKEQKVWELDQLINLRGVHIDVESVLNADHLVEAYKARLRERCKQLTGLTPGQTGALAKWIRDEGYEIANLQMETLQAAIKDNHCPKYIRDVIRCRYYHEMKAPAKYKALLRTICEDSRVHGMFLYCGAGTGRWSSQFVQLQNLFRPIIEDPDTAIECFRARDLDWLMTLYSENPMRVLASCVRGVLAAAPDHDIVAMDYNAIEGRVTAWFAGQEDKLQIYRTHGKAYEYTAAQIYGLPDELDFLLQMKHTHPDERFVGKTAELALGFQGGWKAFAKMAHTYGVSIDRDRSEQIKEDWRSVNPRVVTLWDNLNNHAIAAVANPGEVFKTNNLMFKVDGDFLYMRLPSGRRISYYQPRIEPDPKFGTERVTYYGIDTYTRQWGRVGTYGGKLTENAVQGTARDVLVNGMFNIEAAGYTTVGTVHDELILEVPKGLGDLGEVEQLMVQLPDWAEGLPVAAEGFRAERYRK